MTSTIKVDTIQTAAGGVPRAEDLGIDISGTLVQMQYTTAQTNITSSSSTKLEIISVNITPRFSDSLIKVTFHGDWQQTASGNAHIWLSRDDGSGIYNAITDGSWNTTADNAQEMWQYWWTGNGGNMTKNNDNVFVVDAKVTQQITFKVWGGAQSGTYAIGNNNKNQQLIVEEIAQ